METDIKYLKQAIENSKKSSEEGNFPAGAIVVVNDEVVSSDVSSPYPGLLHADSKAVQHAFEKLGPLNNGVLYVGLQPCLMCTGVVYWSGIRKVVYAVPKSKVNPDYYETPEDTDELLTKFNDKIEFMHLEDLEDEALNIIRDWEKQHGF